VPLLRSSRLLVSLTVCCVAVSIAGCGTASSPRDVAGVRAMYRSIGIDASAGNWSDICMSYMDAALRKRGEALGRGCFSPSLERWAEKVRLSKLTPTTRIAISGSRAVIYDGTRPEAALYTAGEWRLQEVPELGSG
jgi:hypothetical protein